MLASISSLFLALVLQSPKPTQQQEDFRLLFIGDSLTAGYGLQISSAYPALVEKRFRKEGISVKAINAGVSGDTSAGGLRRLAWQLKAKPDFVVIALGANDMLRGLPPQTTKENLKAMIERLQAKQIPVALVGMYAAGNLGEEFEDKFNRIYSSLAREQNIPLLDFLLAGVAKKPELNLEDGIHPNKEGQKIMAQRMFKFLKPLIQKRLENKESGS